MVRVQPQGVERPRGILDSAVVWMVSIEWKVEAVTGPKLGNTALEGVISVTFNFCPNLL
jgi:hypothetical protein